MLPLLAREDESVRLERWLDDARRGRGGTAAVVGAPGIGKTALLEWGAARARDRGFLILRARGGELESDHPYRLVRQLFHPLLAGRDATGLLAGPAVHAAAALGLGTDGPDDPSATFNGLFWLCARLCAEQPLVLAADDVHWGDVESLRWLAYLGHRLEGLPAGLIVGLRAQARTLPHVAALLDVQPLVVLEPSALDEAAVAQAVSTCRPGSDAAFVRACHTATGGTPLYLVELLAEIVRQGIPANAEGARQIERLNPGGISVAVLVRLARLGEDERALARAVAVLGLGVPVALAARLAGLESVRAEAAADALAAAGVLAPIRPLDFIHPIVRTAVYEDHPAGARSAWHRRAAGLLADDPAAAAVHLIAVEPAGDREVVAVLLAAGRQALDGGTTAAALRFLRRARTEPPDADQAGEVLVALGQAAVGQGEPDALDVLREAVGRVGDPLERGRLATAAIQAAYQRGDAGAVDDLVAGVAGELRAQSHDATANQMVTLHEMFSRSADPGLAPWLRDRVDELPEGDSGRAAFSGYLADVLMITGAGQAAEVVRRARETLASARVPHDSAAHWCAVGALSDSDLVDEALSHYETALADARRSGSEVAYLVLSTHIAFAQVRQGRLRPAEAGLRAALDSAPRWQEPFSWVPIARATLAKVLVWRGQFDEAQAVLDRSGAGSGEDEGYPERHLMHARALAALAHGDARTAVGLMQRVRALMEGDGALNPAWWPWRADTVLVLCQGGDVEQARALAEEDVTRARAFGARSAIGRGLRAQARAVGDRGGAHDLLVEACKVLSEAPDRREQAAALVDLGAHLRRAGLRVQARERLREGLDLAAACDAQPIVAVARDELRASGARLRRDRTSGAGALTPAEERVAREAASGYTNREIAQRLFISPKTVEMHLQRSYRKLDISSRVDLTAALGGD